MDLILGNLAILKAFVLPETERAETTWDAALQVIGKGIAGSMEKYCNRHFPRAVDATYICSAARSALVLDRYPVEVISSLEILFDQGDTWENITDMIRNNDLGSGMIYLIGTQGRNSARLRVTFTGGYYVDTTEDGSGVQPAGSTELPGDLQFAWLTQCAHLWSLRDNVGAASLIAERSKYHAPAKLADSNLVPAVQDVLNQYRRFGF